jgi:hypothetical protein
VSIEIPINLRGFLVETEKVISLGRLIWGLSSHFDAGTSGILREICVRVAWRNSMWKKFLLGGELDEVWLRLLYFCVGEEYLRVILAVERERMFYLGNT